MKKQVSWSPTARCTRAAATEESTPPDSAQMTFASPTWARMRSTCSSMTLPVVQVGSSPATSNRKLPGPAGRSRSAAPPGATAPGQAPVRIHERGHGGPVGGGQDLEACGGLGHGVAVAHPHVLGHRGAGQEGGAAAERGLGGPVLAQPGARDRPAQRPGHDLEAVADAEHRHAGLEQGRVPRGGLGGVDAGGPAGEDDRRGVLREHVLRGHRVRHDLRVDAGIAHAAGDQLGVLGAVVHDEDRAVLQITGGWGLGGGHTRPFGRSSGSASDPGGRTRAAAGSAPIPQSRTPRPWAGAGSRGGVAGGVRDG
ncbi:Uncharacterised protein [Rothia kristinae]|nr:Uncharacterised protein [Rothia kristinae]